MQLADEVDGTVFAGDVGGEGLDFHAFDVELDEDALGVGVDYIAQGDDGDFEDASVGLGGVEAALVCLTAVEGDGSGASAKTDLASLGVHLVEVEVLLDLGHVMGDGLADYESRAGVSCGFETGLGAKGEEADVAAAVDDEVGAKAGVEGVDVSDAELAGATVMCSCAP